MGALLKKAELQGIVEGLVELLGSDETVGGFVHMVLDYQDSLVNADELTTEEGEMLNSAREYIAMQRTALVGGGVISEQMFSAMEPDESGGDLPKALALVQNLSGGTELRKNAIKLAGIKQILGGMTIPLVISNGSARYGVKASGKGKKSSNPDRPSVKALKIGLGHAVYWRYAKVWYELFRTPTGYRLFNLTTREELTNAENLPESPSAAQKLATGSWMDAFRGYSDTLPEDAGVDALKPEEIS